MVCSSNPRLPFPFWNICKMSLPVQPCEFFSKEEEPGLIARELCSSRGQHDIYSFVHAKSFFKW